MKYDLEIVVPVTSKFKERVEDFKRYGILNTEKFKILLTPLMSGENIPGIEDGWGAGVFARAVFFESKDFVSNLYKYFLDREAESKWIMKLDDDSCTDIEDLISNLERFYSSDEKMYLATSLSRFVGGKEFELRGLYEKFFGKSFIHFHHEIEMAIISHSGLKCIQSNKESVDFLKERCELTGGATDLALAYAATLAKMPPITCPFSTHFPLINQMTVFGGHLNHIHLVSRVRQGDNFSENDRCGELQYEALARAIDGKMNEIERSICGKKFVMETDHELRLYEFYPDRTARIKFDCMKYIWLENEGKIHMFCDPRDIRVTLELQEDGSLKGEIDEGQEILLRPLGRTNDI
jgi:hypothetical protein